MSQIMKYEAGMLQVVTAAAIAAKEADDYEVDWPPSGCAVGTFYLPHSCSEWIIGGREEARQLWRDLTALLGQLNPEDTING